MNYFNVFVYVKLDRKSTHDINGVWSVSMPQSIPIKDALHKAELTLKHYLKDKYLLSPNVVSQTLHFGSSIRDLSNDDDSHMFASTEEQLPIRKTSPIIYDSMIKAEVDLTHVEDDALYGELQKRLKSPESKINKLSLMQWLHTEGELRGLVVGLDNFNELLMDAGIDASGLEKEQALEMMSLLINKVYMDERMIELTKEVALEAGLRLQEEAAPEQPLLRSVNM